MQVNCWFLFKSLNLSQKEMMWWFSNIWVLQINQVMNDHVNIETNGSEVYTLISRNPMYFLAFFINLWEETVLKRSLLTVQVLISMSA